jgi:hypothetical protein
MKVFFTEEVDKFSKIWVGDPGSGIRDIRSRIRNRKETEFRIRDTIPVPQYRI